MNTLRYMIFFIPFIGVSIVIMVALGVSIAKRYGHDDEEQ